MYRLELIKSCEILPVIQELLKEKKSVRLTVTGSSMHPFLLEGRDSVELSSAEFSDVKKGDIVLILRENGQYVLHRIISRGDHVFYIVGDAQKEIEGPLYPEQLIAVVTSVWRANRHIKCSDSYWKILSLLWLKLLPLRNSILKICRNILKLKSKGTALVRRGIGCAKHTSQ